MCDDSVNVFSLNFTKKGVLVMKVVYPICCGVNVHKSFLVATIIKTDGIMPKFLKKRFSMFNNSILQFKQWLIDIDCYDVCIESTGKYPIRILREYIRYSSKLSSCKSSEKNRFQNSFTVCNVALILSSATCSVNQ